MSKAKKTVRISESDLVNLIDGILTEAVEIKKSEWLQEQAEKGDKNAILEGRIAKLEALLNKKAAAK